MADDRFEVELDGFPYQDDAEQTSGREPVEVLLTEILERERNGEHPSLEEYASKHPLLADQLREMYPIVAAMEQWKRRTEASMVRDQPLQDLRSRSVGRCRIIRELARGGMGVVFEAEHETLGRRVAVKLLPWRSDRLSHQRLRFEHEAQLASSLQHPNIVHVLEFGEWDGLCYYVMPFVEGVGLDWIIERLRSEEGIVYADEIAALRSRQVAPPADPQPSPARAATQTLPAAAAGRPSGPPPSGEISTRNLRRNSWKGFALIGLQAADALRYAHGKSMVHRDVKPANFLLDSRGRVWITDFGLATILDDDAVATSDDLAGTPRYMAPERFVGKFDERSDLYALGMTLFELATRQPAFAEPTRAKLIESITTSAPPRPRSINPEIPPAFERIILKAIAADPDKRYQNAGEMLADLLRFVNRRAPGGRGGSLWSRLLRWAQRD